MSMGSIKAVISEPLENHEEYHLLASVSHQSPWSRGSYTSHNACDTDCITHSLAHSVIHSLTHSCIPLPECLARLICPWSISANSAWSVFSGVQHGQKGSTGSLSRHSVFSGSCLLSLGMTKEQVFEMM